MALSALYEGTVFHKRYTPKKHILNYRVFTLLIDIDELKSIDKRLRFFSFNRFNLVSFYERDYGDPKELNQTPIRERTLNLLQTNNIDTQKITTIKMLTYPRILGFSFNPLTVFYCTDNNNVPIAIIYEVRNTFGERHNYIYKIPKDTDLTESHAAEKCFHVSPFFKTDGTYTFKLSDIAETISVTINYTAENTKRLDAGFNGRHLVLTDKNLLKLCLKIPFMTLKVVSGILFEAFILWVKGIPVVKHAKSHAYQSTPAILIQNNRSQRMTTLPAGQTENQPAKHDLVPMEEV